MYTGSVPSDDRGSGEKTAWSKAIAGCYFNTEDHAQSILQFLFVVFQGRRGSRDKNAWSKTIADFLLQHRSKQARSLLQALLSFRGAGGVERKPGVGLRGLDPCWGRLVPG